MTTEASILTYLALPDVAAALLDAAATLDQNARRDRLGCSAVPRAAGLANYQPTEGIR